MGVGVGAWGLVLGYMLECNGKVKGETPSSWQWNSAHPNQAALRGFRRHSLNQWNTTHEILWDKEAEVELRKKCTAQRTQKRALHLCPPWKILIKKKAVNHKHEAEGENYKARGMNWWTEQKQASTKPCTGKATDQRSHEFVILKTPTKDTSSSPDTCTYSLED